jgi:TonB family protein
MFADVRKRLLPGLTRDEYRTARASLDRKDFASAESQLTMTRRMLEEAQRIGSSDETMGDLRVLVDGFLDLTRSAAEARATVPRLQTTSAGVQTASPSAASPSATGPSTTDPSLAAPARAALAPRTPAQPLQVYESSAADVVAPVALQQAMPPIPPGLATMLSTIHRSGILDVTIDQQGNVERAVMRESVHPIFDALVVDAARSWRYRPALKDGVAVRYLKTIAIVKQ